MMAQETKEAHPLSFKKLIKLASSLLRLRAFNSSKCKTEAKMATARIKLLRNKREPQVRQMRSDIADLLRSGQQDTARIRVEHVIREENIMAANELIHLFCELVTVRLPIIAKQKECPPDLKEGISSLIYAAPRSSEIPELTRMTRIFQNKYGKDFVSAATDLRPDSGVNRLLIEKMSVRKPGGEFKLKVLKEIAKEYQVEWDADESEKELLKSPEERLSGPTSFVSAGKMPVNKNDSSRQGTEEITTFQRCSNDEERGPVIHFKDSATAAQVAAESAKRAVSAARAAAYFAEQHSQQFSDQEEEAKNDDDTKTQSSDECNRVYSVDSDDEKRCRLSKERKFNIKFDDSGSDSDEEGDVCSTAGIDRPPPTRLPPTPPPRRESVDHIHPKLPDYDKLAARFEALKSGRSS